MLRSAAKPPLRRVLFASLALIANLIAAGVPVLHAWAHETADSHHVVVLEVESVEHSHDEIHPVMLHADCLVVHRIAFDLALALPMPSPELETFVAEAGFALHPVAPMSSRAPPSPGQARAPPLV